MKKINQLLFKIYPGADVFNWTLLLFRIGVSLQLIFAHGLKKLGIGVLTAEIVENPLHLPESFNQFFAIAANVYLPFLVIIGFLTRLAVLPAIAVTLTGFFVVHINDSAILRDAPAMYSMAYIVIFFLGPGRFSIDGFFFKSKSKVSY